MNTTSRDKLLVALVVDSAPRALDLFADRVDGVGKRGEAQKMVGGRAGGAGDWGLKGVGACPLEIRLIRAAIPNSNFLIVTPGVRSTNDASDDQKRTLTTSEAISAGADYLVV